MKKGLKKLVVLAMAGVMTIAPVMTASAETAVAGGTYQMVYAVGDGYGGAPQTASHKVVVSDVPLGGFEEDPYLQSSIADEAKTGYEMKGVYIYFPETLCVPYHWRANAEGSGTWTVTEDYSNWGMEYGGLAKTHTFMVDMNGQSYPDCAFYLYYVDNCFLSDNGSMCYAAFRLPAGYTGNAYFKLFDYNEQDFETGHTLDYYFSGNGESAVSATASTPSWKQDAKGWWVERPDGSYLVNEWYQSPASGLWYYMGADGYMVTNTTTPDGYKVNADGSVLLSYFEENNITCESLEDMDLPLAVTFSEDGKAVEYDGMWIEGNTAHYTFGEVTSEPAEEEGYIKITLPYTVSLSMDMYNDISNSKSGLTPFNFNYEAASFSVGDYYTGLLVPGRKLYEDEALENFKEYQWGGENYSIKSSVEVVWEDGSFSDWKEISKNTYHIQYKNNGNIVNTIIIPEGYDGTVLCMKRNGPDEVSFEGATEESKVVDMEDKYFLDEGTPEEYIFYRLSDIMNK